MPDRSYIPHVPPTILDRTLHHPFELTLAAWWIICGAVLGLSLVWPELPTSPSIASLPWVLALTLSGLVGNGGVLVVFALLRPWETNIATGWFLERIGLAIAGAGWLTYATAVAIAYPGSLVSWSLGLVMATAALLRFAATIVVESRTRRVTSRREA